ncbi:MAG: spore germination protein [Eubacteriaceae bacterium]|nr:spore germination protein [Eubacteriaceae bacterium]
MSLFNKNKKSGNNEKETNKANKINKSSESDSSENKAQKEKSNSEQNKKANFDKAVNKKSNELTDNKDNNNEKKLSSSFEENIETINDLFNGDDTIVKRHFQNEHGLKFYLFYSDGLVNSIVLNQHIMQPLLECEVKKSKDSIENLLNRVINVSETKVVSKLNDIVQSVNYGDTVLLVDGQDHAVIMSSKSFFMRSVTEPQSEISLEGPREGFTEVLLANLSLVKRKLRSENLKMKYVNLGKVTHTQACICYIDGIVNEKVLKEITSRIEKIDIDGVFDVNYISELTRTMPYSLFRQSGITEKPDTVAAKLLEGRVALFVDGSPVVMTVPYLFIENFQTSDDYYTNFFYGSIARFLKVISFFFSIIAPAFYVALVAFHKEMLPTVFFINIATERAGVPFPVVVEMVLVLVIFDLLREAGLRMPSNIGTALSIVGALVIGQAAVQAKLIDSAVIIIVAFSAITGLVNAKMFGPVIIIRLVFIVATGIFGLFGLTLAIAALSIHIYNLDSYGVPQIQYFEEFKFQNYKDYVIRSSWTNMKKRPNITENRTRMNVNNE